jgi:hypothetical protein
MVLASKLPQAQIFCDPNLINANQTNKDTQIFVTEAPLPKFTFPNVTPVVRKRRKPTARKAAVAFGYNPLLSPIVEDRFAELPSPERLSSFIHLDVGSTSPSPPDNVEERLVETESASAGELVVIAARFTDRSFFQKYVRRVGKLLSCKNSFAQNIAHALMFPLGVSSPFFPVFRNPPSTKLVSRRRRLACRLWRSRRAGMVRVGTSALSMCPILRSSHSILRVVIYRESSYLPLSLVCSRSASCALSSLRVYD